MIKFACIAAAVALFSCAPVFAETFTWSSAATGNNNWSAGNSWIGGTPPVSANTTDILFATSLRTSPVDNLATPFTIRSLFFVDNPYSLSGNWLTFEGEFAGIFNNTTTSISNHITLNSTITYQQNGNATFSNTIDGGGGFIKAGAGTVTFNTFNLYNGDTDINAGQIVLGHTQGLLLTTVNLNTNNGINLNGFAAVIGNLAGTGNLNLGSASVSVGTNNTSQAYSGQFSATTGTIDKRGSGTWTLSGAGSSFSRFSVSSGRTVLSGGNLTLTSTSAVNRALMVGNTEGGALDVFAGAALNTVAGGTGSALIKGASGTASTMTVAGAGSRWDASQIDIGGSTTTRGALVADNAGVINAGDIFVGKPGGGSLVIQNGGIVTTTHLNVSSDAADPAPTVALRSGGQSAATETILATPTSSIDVDRGTLHTAMLTSAAGNGSITLRDPFGASALVIDGSSASATYTGSISGSGGITKNGASTQTLSGPNTYNGATTVNAGNLILTNGSSASYNANGAGKITLNFGDLGHSSLRVSGGGTIIYPPTVIGGFIRGSDGQHNLKAVTSFNGTTFAVDSALSQDNPLTLNNVTNSGNFTNNDSLTWDGGVNTSAGTFTVNAKGTLVTAFENNGVIAIQRGGSLTNSNTTLVSGGGSRIDIDSQGQLNLVSSELNLNGSLLINNGAVKGTVNVHFNGLATGSGDFGKINLFENGRFAPGAGASPAVFSPAAVAASQASFATGTSLAIEIGGKTAGSGFDQVNVDGVATLAGTLEVTTANNFVPAALDAFKVVSFASRSCAFSTYAGTLSAANGLAYAPIYSATDLTLIATLPGDANLDGKVDFLDLARLAQSYNSTVSGTTDSWWLKGDFTYDGKVDFLDLARLAQNYNTSALPAAPGEFSAALAADWSKAQELASVPEPSLAALTGLALLLVRTRGCRHASNI
ncbi:MAG: Extracellular serine protease precursor [Phycisphaerales bacterium]|nr:Extracellular serine protease precursor [Phycisphaerales bacterium]